MSDPTPSGETIMSTRKLLGSAKIVAHAGGLVFCAFWLVATSSPNIPAHDCFTGLKNPTKLAVTLGPALGDSTGTQSCAGLDGFAPGTTIELNLSQGTRVGDCLGYQTDAISGPVDVTPSSFQGHVTLDYLDNLTEPVGTYSSSHLEGCRGTWVLAFGPNVHSDKDHLVSPLDQGPDGRPAQTWHLEREISIDQVQLCGGALSGSGPEQCRDSFEVMSISEIAP
jgi:hypothetical protein